MTTTPDNERREHWAEELTEHAFEEFWSLLTEEEKKLRREFAEAAMTVADAEADRHHAAVLRSAADHIETTCPARSETSAKPCVHCSGPADRLRRLAENVEDGQNSHGAKKLGKANFAQPVLDDIAEAGR